MKFLAAGLLVATLAWSASPAQGQAALQTDDQKIDAAIQTLKKADDPNETARTGFASELGRARQTLASLVPASLPKLTALLAENEIGPRLNAAVTLAEIARPTGAAKPLDPGVITALQRCMNDSNAGVSHYGILGLMGEGIPMETRLAAVEFGLKLEREPATRVRVIWDAVPPRHNIPQAAPLLVKHMQELLPDYRKQLDAGLLAPLPEGAPPETPRQRIDPERLATAEEAEKLAQQLEKISPIGELHQAGLAVEKLLPGTSFGFAEAPPWKLEACVTQAVAWLERAPAAPAPAPGQ